MAHSDAPPRLKGSRMALVTGHEPRASLHPQAGTLHWTAQRSASPCVWVPVPSQTTAAPAWPSERPPRLQAVGLSQVHFGPCPHRCRCGCMSSLNQPPLTHSTTVHQHSGPAFPTITHLSTSLAPTHHTSSALRFSPATSTPAPTNNAPRRVAHVQRSVTLEHFPYVPPQSTTSHAALQSLEKQRDASTMQ